MAFVKLNRSWFNCGTIITSQVSLAKDPSLCLQMTSNYSLVGAADALPISYHHRAVYGNQVIYTQFSAHHVAGGS